MYESRRPGGLTALAVFNFVFGGFAFLGVLSLIIAFWAYSQGLADQQQHQHDPDHELTIREQNEIAQQKAMKELGPGFWIAAIIANALTGALMLISGIGYLKQKRILGRLFGNAYAILGLLSVIGFLVLAPKGAPNTDFSLGTIGELLYPLLTLIMINGSFKEDFVS